MVTDGRARFTKTNFSRSFTRSWCHTSAAEQKTSENIRTPATTDRLCSFIQICINTRFQKSSVSVETDFYLNVEGSGAGDDFEQVVSQQEIPESKNHPVETQELRGRVMCKAIICLFHINIWIRVWSPEPLAGPGSDKTVEMMLGFGS